ncbi:MAG: helix-turn-helix domain-containing protein [Actinomycetota bacterium]|nr:helix-turn-helix domain-containing protein [Actinomycetota bacterium]
MVDSLDGPEAIRSTLEGAVRHLPASGAALVRPHPVIASPWRVDYAGGRKRETERWLRERLEPSLEASARHLTARAPCSSDLPLVLTLRREGVAAGLFVLWPHAGADPGERIDGLRETLEVLLEVEHGEATYFGGPAGTLDAELAGALGRGDVGALPALLSLVRTVGGADIAYWGSVRGGVVEVERHLGARDGGFGFRLPLGEGVGGRAVASGSTVEVPDYRNCQYRYPGVSDVTDGEKVRSTLAIPVRGSSGGGAVLYAARRSVEPFTPAQRILLRRVARSVEPAPGLPPAPHLFTQDLDYARLQRSELRKLIVGSNRARDVEAWLERTIGGPAVLLDAHDRPYTAGNLLGLERLIAPRGAGDETCLELPLRGSGGTGEHGRLRLRPSVELPPEGWKDFFDDVLAACNVVLDRMEQTHDRLNRQRSLWLGEVAEGRSGRDARRDGNRLGLPVEKGEVWAVSWEPGARTDGAARLAMLAEDLVLDKLGDPLVSLDEGVGVVLLRERPRGQGREGPSAVRDALLRYVGPGPLWLVHGVAYKSFEDLREALNQAVGVAKRLREAGTEPFVSEVDGCGLDGLLENPRVSEDLAAFANRMLKPLLDHDARGGSKLTGTFCLTLTLGSPARAAERLYVHENTVRYRMGQAQKLLGRDLSLPK